MVMSSDFLNERNGIETAYKLINTTVTSTTIFSLLCSRVGVPISAEIIPIEPDRIMPIRECFDAEQTHLLDIPMTVSLNGNQIVCDKPNLLEFLSNHGYANLDGCAVAVNDMVVPKSVLSERHLQANDKILIITATQGG
jgi:sulfur carrier protein